LKDANDHAELIQVFGSYIIDIRLLACGKKAAVTTQRSLDCLDCARTPGADRQRDARKHNGLPHWQNWQRRFLRHVYLD
jgi:hypothetical protein